MDCLMCEHSQAASKMRPSLFLTALLLFLLSAAAGSAPKPQSQSLDKILRQYVEAQQGLNLRGEVLVVSVIPQGGPTRTTRKKITRTRDGASLAICTTPGGKPGMITVDDGMWTSSYVPQQKAVNIRRSLPPLRDPRAIMRQVRLIQRNYNVRLVDELPMAGQVCHLLRLEPRDPMSHPLQLWVDKRTGAELGRLESDWRGNTLNLATFTWVKYPANLSRADVSYAFPPSARRINYSRSALLKDVLQLRKAAGFDICLPLAMPGGFEFDHCAMVIVQGRPAAFLRYTDGMSNITICQSPRQPHQPSGYRSVVNLPGDPMVVFANKQTNFMVMGRCEVEGLIAVSNAMNEMKEHQLLSQMAQVFHAKYAALAAMRNRGLGFDAMAALLEIQARTGRKIEQLLSLHDDGWDWQQLAHQFRVKEAYIWGHVRRLQSR